MIVGKNLFAILVDNLFTGGSLRFNDGGKLRLIADDDLAHGAVDGQTGDSHRKCQIETDVLVDQIEHFCRFVVAGDLTLLVLLG